MSTTRKIRRGEIFWAHLGKIDKSNPDSVQRNDRPVIVVSNDDCNWASPVLTVIPLTTRQTKSKLPTHVPIKCVEESIALAEQITVLPKSELWKYIGQVSKTELESLNKAIKVQLQLA